jgi:hypothetical protein
MKKMLFISAIFILVTCSSAHDSIELKNQYHFNYLNDSSVNKIGFGCGGAGLTSDNLYHICELISENRFDLIVKLLDSKIASSRYLAALSLIRADKKSVYKSDSLTGLKIETLRQDKEKISFCVGCTGQWIFSLKILLEKKSKAPMANWTERWIKDCFKNRQ